MKYTPKPFVYGGVVAVVAATVAVIRVARQAAGNRRRYENAADQNFDQLAIETEEVVVVTDAGPYAIEMELICAGAQSSRASGRGYLGRTDKGQPVARSRHSLAPARRRSLGVKPGSSRRTANRG